MTTPVLEQLLNSLRDAQALPALDSVPAEALIQAATSAAPAVVALAVRDAQAQGNAGPLVVVTATGSDAEAFTSALGSYLDPATVAIFPSWETLPHERLSPRSDTVARRLATLRRVVHPQDVERETGLPPVSVVVAPVRALLQPMVAGLADLVPVMIRKGEVVDLTAFTEGLGAAAYTRVDMVERRGEFAVRGGIIDVFAPTDPHPVRIEFFGDEVDSIRSFSVADQRSLVDVDQLWAPPCRELLLTDAVRSRASALQDRIPAAADMLGRIASGVPAEGMESLIPALVDHLVPLTDVLPVSSRLVVIEPTRIARRAEDLQRTAGEFLSAAWVAATAGADAPIEASEGSFLSLDEVREGAAERGITWWGIGPFGALDAVATGIAEVEDYRGRLPVILDAVRARLAEGWRVVITAAGSGSAHRIVEQCSEAEIPARSQREYEPVEGVVSVVPHITGAGYQVPDAKLLVLHESDLTGRRADAAGPKVKVASRRRNAVDPLQLRTGDFVVHEQHGVGKFIELTKRTVRGTEREYLVIEYAPSKRGHPGDKLSVPTDQLDQITKYVGGEAPAVSKMGGADWAKTKGRARKAVKEIAAELIRLYSARMATRGREFGPDTPWQRELEEAFPFVETPDQLSTIDDVKEDMEKAVPMDRLICGDVGFGKTEIAVRAAFKAIQDGAQPAM